MKVASIALTLLLSASAAHAETYQLITACTATLSVISADPADEDIVLTVASEPFAPTVEGFSRSRVSIDFDEFRLTASMAMRALSDGEEFEPMFDAELFKGNPVTGRVNYGVVGGLELDARPVNAPLKVSSTAFIEAHYDGHSVSRVDYTCSLTKV